MSDFIFKRNKSKYLFLIILLFILFTFVVYFSILFISNSSHYISALMPNELIVFLVGCLGILGAVILSYIIVKSIFNKDFFIRINQSGLFIGILQYSNKLVFWKDITKIESVEINGIKHIIIQVNNVEYYKSKEKGIQKYFFISRTEKYGTPFVLNISALESNFNDIFESLKLNWKKFR